MILDEGMATLIHNHSLFVVWAVLFIGTCIQMSGNGGK